MSFDYDYLVISVTQPVSTTTTLSPSKVIDDATTTTVDTTENIPIVFHENEAVLSSLMAAGHEKAIHAVPTRNYFGKY